MTVNFEKIGFKSSKTGVCPGCGKKATRTNEFYQTQNPWNQKTVTQIFNEEHENEDFWKTLPTYHKKCEPAHQWQDRENCPCPICFARREKEKKKC